MPHTIEIKLLGQRIALKAQDADPEFAAEVAKLVSARIEEAERRVRNAAPHQVAVLALATLAEEYLQSKRRVADHHSRIDQRARELMDWVEAETK
jgi:cell division protein ZapA (FtsZ GTPase activity inhibitor)